MAKPYPVIAILGDLHGHFTLAYRLLRRWERESGESLSAILQVGDAGIYPPPFRADAQTMAFYERDPDELGFAEYHGGGPEAAAILGPEAPPKTRIAAPLYFIKGNHDDFGYLHGLANAPGRPVAVDPWGMIRYLRSGQVFSLPLGEGHSLKVAVLGGIARTDTAGPGVDPVSENYTRSEVRQLNAGPPGPAIFLSHDVPRDAVCVGEGSSDIADYIRSFMPAWHFCGHYHEPGLELDAGPQTRSHLLNEVNFRKPSSLNRGCIGILRLVEPEEPASWEFEILGEPWLRQYTRANFRTLEE